MDDNYNSFFYANACHVCKQFGRNVRLKRCGGCGMIAYCGQQHQRQHWPRHRRLCKVIQDVLSADGRMRTRDVSLREWTGLKMNLMLVVLMKLSRRLDEYEMQMFRFPRACLVCHERDNRLLEDCQNCASVSYCEKHRDSTGHTCDLLKLCFNLDAASSANVNGHPPNLDYLQRIAGDRASQDMKDFMNAHTNVTGNPSGMSAKLAVAVHSEYLTRPLTLLHGLRRLNNIPRCDSLIVHVVAANFIELETASAWELLLHLIPNVTSVRIIMIGPEMPRGNITMSICKNCVAQRRELLFETHSMLYENYVGSLSFVKPDLAVGFNTGIHECVAITNPGETWVPSIRALAEQNCPLILSCYTRAEAQKEAARINAILENETKYVYSGRNPFASLRPYRDYETEDVFYQNNYVIIYRALRP